MLVPTPPPRKTICISIVFNFSWTTAIPRKTTDMQNSGGKQSLLWKMCKWQIGQFFPLSLVTVPDEFANFNSEKGKRHCRVLESPPPHPPPHPCPFPFPSRSFLKWPIGRNICLQWNATRVWLGLTWINNGRFVLKKLYHFRGAVVSLIYIKLWYY